jgi:DNA-directed RNA polymerase specialized sigma24 family protein
VNGLTPREIARMQGVPESAIRVRLLRARRAARLRIEQARRSHAEI